MVRRGQTPVPENEESSSSSSGNSDQGIEENTNTPAPETSSPVTPHNNDGTPITQQQAHDENVSPEQAGGAAIDEHQDGGTDAHMNNSPQGGSSETLHQGDGAAEHNQPDAASTSVNQDSAVRIRLRPLNRWQFVWPAESCKRKPS